MSPDEADSWNAAAAPSVAQVILRQAKRGTATPAAGGVPIHSTATRPGKLPIHELLLHGWMAMFGSSLAAMRALSAALGTLAILLVYAVARETLAAGGGGREPAPGISPPAAAIAALLFAVNTVAIKYSREMRMYPLMIAAAVAQTTVFLRAIRRGGIANYCGAAVLTILAIAANFSVLLLPAAEGLWLLYLAQRAGWRPADARVRRAFAVAIALAVPAIILAPVLFASFHASAAATAGGYIKWIKPPPFYAPIALFNKAAGSLGFPVLAALAAWGAVAGFRGPFMAGRARDGAAFALLWMWVPPILLLIVSYALTPIFVERYALSSFVPFFILAGIGIAALPDDRWRAAALAAAVLVSLGHLRAYDRKPHDAQYREAFAAADAALHPGDTAAIVPGYAIDVLRYYMPSSRLEAAVEDGTGAGRAAILILGNQNLSPRAAAEYRMEFPQLIARLRGVTVLRK